MRVLAAIPRKYKVVYKTVKKFNNDNKNSKTKYNISRFKCTQGKFFVSGISNYLKYKSLTPKGF